MQFDTFKPYTYLASSLLLESSLDSTELRLLYITLMIFREIALIPARGGSRGIKRKNLAHVGGQSLLVRTILAAKGADIFDRIYVSSEDMGILEIAKSEGVSTILRSNKAALDTSTAADVVWDFLMSKSAKEYDSSEIRLTYLQPTSPFRGSEHILSAIAVANHHISKSCVSICSVTKHPYKMVKVDGSSLHSIREYETSLASNRQELPEFFIPNGAIYTFPVSRFLTDQDFPVIGSGYLHMSELTSIDIDTEIDLIFANSLES